MQALSKYENFLRNIFSDTSMYLIGEELSDLLQKEFSISDDNCRKIIQRAVIKGVIKSSSPLTFGKKRFVYFGENIKLNKETVKRITKQYRPPVYRLLSLLDINEGILSYYEALKITSSPLDESSTKVSTLVEIITDLKSIKLIEEVTDQANVKYLIDYNKLSETERLKKLHYTRMYLDTVFLSDILVWLRKHNIIDNESVRFRNKSNPSIGVKHNNLVWDAIAYTKTTGIHIRAGNDINKSENKQTLVVLDVVINREYTDDDLQGFFSRIQIILNSVNKGIRKVMPIIVCKGTSSFVLNKISKLGFILLNLGTIYGENIYDIINKLDIIKSNQLNKLENSDQFVENIESALSTIRGIGQEANLENIKGDLFEPLLHPLLSNLYPDSIIYQGKIIKSSDSDEKYEYDFIVISPNNDEIVVVEAKGYKSTAIIKLGDQETKNTVRWFFRKTFPFIKKYYNSNDIFNYPVKGCYVTTANFEQEAITALDKLAKSKIKPNNLDLYYSGKTLLELVDSRRMTKMSTLLKKYYMNIE